MFCLKCGAQNADGFKFCMNCGAELPELAPQATPAPQPEPPAPDAPAADQVPPATAPESQPEPVPQPEPPAPDASAPQAAPAAPEPPAGFPVPPTPFAAAPQPAQPVPPAPAPQPAQTMPQPVVPEPPQEWPSGAPADPFQSAPSPKGPRTGMIVGIVVGVLAIVAIGVCAFLFMSGTGTPGGQPAQEPPAVQDDGDVADDKGDKDDKDDGDAADDKGGAATGVEVLGSADGTLFDPEFYARDPASLEAALVERGLSLESSTAFHYEDMEDSLYVSYAGRVDEVFPVEGSDDEVNVSIYLEAEDFAFAWEDDYASDVVTSLAELPEGSVVCSMDVSFEADAETEDFPALVGAMADALSVSGDVISVSGTSSELVDGACELLGVDEGDCSISISGGMSFDSLAVSYDDGFYLNVTKYGTGDVMANYSFYF